jgi:hypothetical protein
VERKKVESSVNNKEKVWREWASEEENKKVKIIEISDERKKNVT